MHLAKQTAFTIPVIDGELCLGQRVKEPYRGQFAAIGGKSEPQKSTPFTAATLQGYSLLQYWDHLIFVNPTRAILPEGEAPIQTAARETAEEIKQGMPAVIRDLFHIGWYTDRLKGKNFWLHHYLCQIDQPVALKPDEIHAMQPLSELVNDRVATPTEQALRALAYGIHKMPDAIPEVYRNLVIPARWHKEPNQRFIESIRSHMLLTTEEYATLLHK